ncbi:hypothetical protein [Microbulbifer sp. ARAS458-1]|uniref:hypothetical protein n=1 Tax=Microbulbifer sp. ARAS458-1 TaxID=3140242 RepID=UPI003877E1C4
MIESQLDALRLQCSDYDERVFKTAQLFADTARAAGMQLSFDLRIGEADAAAVLGYSPDHLQRIRREKTGPTAYRRGIGNKTRVSYRLVDLAHWIEGTRER